MRCTCLCGRGSLLHFKNNAYNETMKLYSCKMSNMFFKDRNRKGSIKWDVQPTILSSLTIMENIEMLKTHALELEGVCWLDSFLFFEKSSGLCQIV